MSTHPEFSAHKSVLTCLFFFGILGFSTNLTSSLKAQQKLGVTLSGVVTDPSGASLTNSTIVLHPTAGVAKAFADLTVSTNSAGHYLFSVPPGMICVLTATAPGFASFHSAPISLVKPRLLDIQLSIAEQYQQIDVSVDNPGDTDPNNNGDAVILTGSAIAELPIDETALTNQLNALAGGSSPDIRLDGFTGGTLPPRNTIREIRINQNPYSAQNDTNPGNGQVDIFTKPGGSEYHGQLYLYGNDSSFNALSPLLKSVPPYYAYNGYGTVGGPVTRHTSFFGGANHGSNQTDNVVTATILDSNYNPVPLTQAVASPQTFNGATARIDTGFGNKNTMAFLYRWNSTRLVNAGIGELSLAEQGYTSQTDTQTLQASNSQVLSPKIVNNTRFQYLRTRTHQVANSSAPTLVVQGAFVGGGNSTGSFHDNEDRYELQSYVAHSIGSHYLNYGGRLRVLRDANESVANYNGEFTFNCLALSSCATGSLATASSYQATKQGLPRAAGGGASQYLQTIGTPAIVVTVADLGLFFQDDWKARPNLTLSYGLRFETQNHVADHDDIAPRVGFAWNPFLIKGKPAKYTVRGGAGVFYKRFASSNILNAERQNGVTQQQYVVSYPDTYPALPALNGQSPSAIYQVSPRYHSPYYMSATISLQRQLGKYGSITGTYLANRGNHILLTRNINAPLPGTYTPGVPASGTRPLGGDQDVYEYDTSGVYNTNRLSANVNLRPVKGVSVYGNYTLHFENTDTSGGFPSNSYNLGADYGRSTADTRQTLGLGMSSSLPYGFNVSAFLNVASSAPFNITTGQDLNGDAQFTDRPAFATDLTRPSVVATRFGVFDTSPIAGQAIIPINYGNGPSVVDVFAHLDRSFAVGPVKKVAGGASAPKLASGQKTQIERKYALTLGLSAQNLFNHPNYAPPIGVLNSPLFGQSTSINGSASPASNRTLYLTGSFSF